ncbi:hypothetical protein JJB07_14680 [Tumebacillus sp. ITR2]|uniref:Secreted protein n=1 Tax=Tumebacillus amylolyticus TaxID=2801339 RepID=A0ABS1JCC3_9BACL|nr:hypothetical protein [Tumebacillus amylolyticus]MBL0387884.1 hypothetical protein [Tumebacillus amylolyticus]
MHQRAAARAAIILLAVVASTIGVKETVLASILAVGCLWAERREARRRGSRGKQSVEVVRR